MKKEEIIKKIKQNRWYRQAGNAKVYYLLIPTHGVIRRMGQDLYLTPITDSVKWEGYINEDYYDKKAKELIEKTKKNPQWFDEEFKIWEEKGKNLEKFWEEFPNVSNLDYKEVRKLIKQLDDLNIDFWDYAYYPDYFDPNGEKLLHEEVRQLSNKEISIMLKFNKLSYSQKQRLEMLKNIDYDDQFLNDQVKNYYWIDNSWESTKLLTKADFEKKIDEVKEQTEEEREEQLLDLESDWENEQGKIVEEHDLPEQLVNVLKLYQKLFFIRDQRKKYVLLNNHYYDLLFMRIAEITNIPFKEFNVISEWDLDNPDEIMNIVKERKKYMVGVYAGTNYRLMVGDDAKEIVEELHNLSQLEGNLIEGTTGCKGKAMGKVRIVMGETHFGKFNDGEILVAPSTRPEYVPLMKKAKAIITDEGGITSHAAVISRELGVPCVIGTKIATKVLKDNDIVEVDADKGVINIK